MQNQQICPQCHNRTFHFDRSRHAVVCDVCGWGQNAAEQTNEQLVYDQQRQKAIAYVKAKDYSSAKPFLDKMRQIRPDDPDIYYLHMMGISDCCQNLLLLPADKSSHELFEHYWGIYSSLTTDQSVFREYRRKRHLALREKLQKRVYKYIIISLCCYLALLFSFSMLSEGAYWGIISAIVSAVFILNKRPLTNLVKVTKELNQAQRKQ